jgi:hypothetical protein
MLLTLALPAALLTAAPVAHGAGALEVTQLQPGQSTNLAPGRAVTFRVTSSCVNQPMFVEVANTQTRDEDGTLADAGRQDYLSMEAAPDGTYTATAPSGSGWLNTPGTYFWQAQVNGLCGPSDAPIKQVWVSDVVGIVVTKPASGGGEDVTAEADEDGAIITIAEARRAARDGVLKLTRKLPRGLTRRCKRNVGGSLLAVLCTASWYDSSKYRYNGSWRMALNDDGTITARFDGRRAKLACLRTAKQKKRCYRRFGPRTVTLG